MDLTETKDWKDVMKEESVINDKNGVKKQGTKQTEEIDEEYQPPFQDAVAPGLYPFLIMISILIYVTCVDLSSSYLLTN